MQCKKVVKLPTSNYVICPEELQKLRTVLDDAGSSNEQLLRALRALDSYVLHSNDLTNSLVGRSVKSLRKHGDADVSMLAARLTEKWRSIVLNELA